VSAAAHNSNDAGAGEPAVFDVERVEFAFDQRGRFALFESEFGTPMDRAAKFDDARHGRFAGHDDHLRRVRRRFRRSRRRIRQLR
jgi:hypothetical protein